MGKNSLKKMVFILTFIAICYGFLSSNVSTSATGLLNFQDPKDSAHNLESSDVYYRSLGSSALGIAISGDFAYVANFVNGLAIINISDPTNPSSPIYRSMSGNAYGVFVDGDYVYVTTSNGLAIVDISDPTSPGSPVYKDTLIGDNDVFVSGDYAYLAEPSFVITGLAVIDVSDPTSPGDPDYLSISDNAHDIFVDGDYAYLAAESSGLAIVNITDPTSPGSPIYHTTTLPALGVYVSGDYAFVSTGGVLGNGGFEIINITNPKQPSTVSTMAISGSIPLDGGGIWVSGNRAYIASASGLCVIGISNLTSPGSPVYQTLSDNTPYDLAISGNYAFLADHNSGLAVVKIGEIIDPTFISWMDTLDYAAGVFISGDYAYVADQSQGLAIIDISDLSSPGAPIYKNTTGTSYRVFVSGDFAYVADGSNGLAIINITDPKNPGNPIYKSTTNPAADLFIAGDYAYIAAVSSGLAIIDISDPTSPGNPVFAPLSFDAVGIFVYGNYAYLVGGAFPYGYLAIVDISNPTSPGTPVTLSTAPTSTILWDLYVSGDYAYIAYGGGSIAVVDVSDPKNPGTPDFNWGYGSVGIFISGDIAYLAEPGYPSLTMVDISDPNNPSDFRRVATYAEDVYVDGDHTFVAAATNGLLIFKTMIPWYVMPAPTVNAISPNPSKDGSINVTWNDITGAENYLIYRDTSPITSITGRTPIASTSTNQYIDTQPNGTYYYVLVANNSEGKSGVSNYQGVTVAIPPEPPIPPIIPGLTIFPPIGGGTFNAWFIIIPIIIGGVAAATIVPIVVHRSKTSKTKPIYKKTETKFPVIEEKPSIPRTLPEVAPQPLPKVSPVPVPRVAPQPLPEVTPSSLPEVAPDPSILARIQEENISELTELVNNYKADIMEKYGPLTHHLRNLEEWKTKLYNYPLSNLTIVDAKELAIMIEIWEKLLQ